jgi:hypothetical protein
VYLSGFDRKGNIVEHHVFAVQLAYIIELQHIVLLQTETPPEPIYLDKTAGM